jgi:hypothetical protein
MCKDASRQVAIRKKDWETGSKTLSSVLQVLRRCSHPRIFVGDEHFVSEDLVDDDIALAINGASWVNGHNVIYLDEGLPVEVVILQLLEGGILRE